jgi:broad specificity phosphatase PhoE
MCLSGLILVRHGESAKNTERRYSAVDGQEGLSVQGEGQVHTTAKLLTDNVLRRQDRCFARIVSAPSKRCLKTAQAIAVPLKLTVSTDRALAPLSVPLIAGQLVKDVARKHPKFARQVELYRAGLLSGYDVEWPGESIRDLERRIVEAFPNEISLKRGDTSILIGHKSSLTCVTILTLRNLGMYPRDYYGYMEMAVGSITALWAASRTDRSRQSVAYYRSHDALIEPIGGAS